MGRKDAGPLPALSRCYRGGRCNSASGPKPAGILIASCAHTAVAAIDREPIAEAVPLASPEGLFTTIESVASKSTAIASLLSLVPLPKIGDDICGSVGFRHVDRLPSARSGLFASVDTGALSRLGWSSPVASSTGYAIEHTCEKMRFRSRMISR